MWGRPVYIAAAAGPALFGIGLTVKNQGAKALTGAEACRAKVDELIARYDEIDVLAGGVQERASELEEILGRLARRATDALNVLESEEFDPESHGIRLQQAWNLSKAVGEVASAQIIGDDGGVSEASQALVFRYRQLPEETNHD